MKTKKIKDSKYWVEKLQLQAHPEGGYFRETYRAPGIIPRSALPGNFHGDRNYATMIYFLLEAGQFSSLHRISADEGWHFYSGHGLTVYVIHGNGHKEEIHLGANADEGEVFQATVPAGACFGARVKEGGSYSLAGCTVAPGFDFADFEMAERAALLEEYPQHKSLIEALTHG